MLTLRTAPAAKHLRSFVRHIQQREANIPVAELVYPIAARCDLFLEFYLADRYRMRVPGAQKPEMAPPSVLVGPSTRRSVDLVLQGHFEVFTIHFQPAGLHALFGLPVPELTDHAFDARAVLGRFVDELQERLARATTFEARVDVVNSMFEARIAGRGPPDPVGLLANSLLPARGALRVDAAAARLGLSLRQFERRFEHQVGITPRLYSNIVRFQSALVAKRARPDRTWLEITHTLGYHDQMHMLRDFRRFATTAPSHFLEQLAAMPERWDDVVFLLGSAEAGR
jgi:AraC-like DNA-binding protein